MAKYGMSMCVLGMAEELKSDGIAVNALWPRTGILAPPSICLIHYHLVHYVPQMCRVEPYSDIIYLWPLPRGCPLFVCIIPLHALSVRSCLVPRLSSTCEKLLHVMTIEPTYFREFKGHHMQ